MCNARIIQYNRKITLYLSFSHFYVRILRINKNQSHNSQNKCLYFDWMTSLSKIFALNYTTKNQPNGNRFVEFFPIEEIFLIWNQKIKKMLCSMCYFFLLHMVWCVRSKAHISQKLEWKITNKLPLGMARDREDSFALRSPMYVLSSCFADFRWQLIITNGFLKNYLPAAPFRRNSVGNKWKCRRCLIRTAGISSHTKRNPGIPMKI